MQPSLPMTNGNPMFWWMANQSAQQPQQPNQAQGGMPPGLGAPPMQAAGGGPQGPSMLQDMVNRMQSWGNETFGEQNLQDAERFGRRVGGAIATPFTSVGSVRDYIEGLLQDMGQPSMPVVDRLPEPKLPRDVPGAMSGIPSQANLQFDGGQSLPQMPSIGGAAGLAMGGTAQPSAYDQRSPGGNAMNTMRERYGPQIREQLLQQMNPDMGPDPLQEALRRRTAFENDYGRFGDRMLNSPMPAPEPEPRNYEEIAKQFFEGLDPERQRMVGSMRDTAGDLRKEMGYERGTMRQGNSATAGGPRTRYDSNTGEWYIDTSGAGKTPEEMAGINQGISERQGARDKRYQDFLAERKDRQQGISEFGRQELDFRQTMNDIAKQGGINDQGPMMQAIFLARNGIDPVAYMQAQAQAGAYQQQGKQQQELMDQQTAALQSNMQPADLVTSIPADFDMATPEGRAGAIEWLKQRGVGLDQLSKMQREFDPSSGWSWLRPGMQENQNIGNWLSRFLMGQESDAEANVRRQRLQVLNQLLGS